jgi:hypothetical protein
MIAVSTKDIKLTKKISAFSDETNFIFFKDIKIFNFYSSARQIKFYIFSSEIRNKNKKVCK